MPDPSPEPIPAAESPALPVAPPQGIPWITSLLIVASVASTGLAELLPDEVYRVLYATESEIWLDRKWWGLLTSIFLHIGIMHLFFNCYWTWLLGRLLEHHLRPVHYLGLIVFTAWIGSAAELAVSGQVGVGLSGVVYGLFGFMLASRSHYPAFGRIANRANTMLMLGWLVLCFLTTYAGWMRVANYAHLGGFISGGLLGLAIHAGRWRVAAALAASVIGLVSFVPLRWAPWHDRWHLGTVLAAIGDGDHDTALVSLRRLRESFPEMHWAVVTEASIRMERKEYAAARDILSAVADRTKDAEVWNSLSWLLATCPDDRIRDGKRAIELARRACEATAWQNDACLDTLAAAYAEAGNFAEAVKWSDSALDKTSRLRGTLQKHREAFAAGRPWRELEATGNP